MDECKPLALGCSIGDAWKADIVCKIRPPCKSEVKKLHDGQVLFCNIYPRQDEALVAEAYTRPPPSST